MRAFVPRTRLQVYKAWGTDIQELQFIVPEKYLVEETIVIVDNKELSFSADGNNYAAELAASTVVIRPTDVVKYNDVEISKFENGHTYNTGDVYYQIIGTGGRFDPYEGTKIVSVGVEPTGTNHASVYRSTMRSKRAPKTNIEKYCAYAAGFYDGELLDPKTVDEKLEYIRCFPSAEPGTITPKTRTQWYRAKALELVEEVPSELLIPQTNIEKYYAYKAGLYEGELPEPKTVDEYILAMDVGWEPAEKEGGKEIDNAGTNK